MKNLQIIAEASGYNLRKRGQEYILTKHGNYPGTGDSIVCGNLTDVAEVLAQRIKKVA